MLSVGFLLFALTLPFGFAKDVPVTLTITDGDIAPDGFTRTYVWRRDPSHNGAW